MAWVRTIRGSFMSQFCDFAGAAIAFTLASMDRRAIDACLPPHLHSFSQRVLEIYLAGHMSTEEFRRWFHMPNSDYLPVSDCIAHLVDPYYIPEAERAGIVPRRQRV